MISELTYSHPPNPWMFWGKHGLVELGASLGRGLGHFTQLLKGYSAKPPALYAIKESDAKGAALLQASAYHQTKEDMEAEYQIIARSQRNPRYFGPIYERYYEPIFIFINRRIDDEENSAELTSIVFYKCLENLRRFEFRGVPFSAWLFRIALNEIRQFFRKEKRHPRAVSLTDQHINLLFEEIEEDPEDKHRMVAELLSQLQPEELQFLELRFFEKRSFREMGYLLDLTEVNAKIKTYRILKKLKKSCEQP